MKFLILLVLCALAYAAPRKKRLTVGTISVTGLGGSTGCVITVNLLNSRSSNKNSKLGRQALRQWNILPTTERRREDRIRQLRDEVERLQEGRQWFPRSKESCIPGQKKWNRRGISGWRLFTLIYLIRKHLSFTYARLIFMKILEENTWFEVSSIIIKLDRAPLFSVEQLLK